MPWLPRRWQAEFLEHVLPGRTQPIVLNCATHAGPYRGSFVTKAIGLPEVSVRTLACELFGNVLARELGIETPTPGLVEIDSAVADALNMALEKRNLHVDAGLAVGSTYVRPLTSLNGRVDATTELEAVGLYGFDLFVQNPDRRVNNPNCALLADRLLAFDFEMCFSFLLPIVGARAPSWEVSRHGIAPKHVMHASLQRRQPEWNSILTALVSLTPESITNLLTFVPDEWRVALTGVPEHLVELIEQASELKRELQGSVA